MLFFGGGGGDYITLILRPLQQNLYQVLKNCRILMFLKKSKILYINVWGNISLYHQHMGKDILFLKVEAFCSKIHFTSVFVDEEQNYVRVALSFLVTFRIKKEFALLRLFKSLFNAAKNLWNLKFEMIWRATDIYWWTTGWRPLIYIIK